MTRFLDTALGFPVVAFTLPLVVVVGYWACVLVGAVDPGGSVGTDLDLADADALVDEPAMFGLGVSGVPVTVTITVLVTVAWFAGLSGTVVVDGLHLPAAARTALRTLLLPLALVVGWLSAHAAAVPIRRLAPAVPAPSRADFVGRTCVVRTASVGPDFGQAEVTASDGSSAIVQVRLAGDAPDAAGWTALIYEYDADGDCFWITPIDLAPTAG